MQSNFALCVITVLGRVSKVLHLMYMLTLRTGTAEGIRNTPTPCSPPGPFHEIVSPQFVKGPSSRAPRTTHACMLWDRLGKEYESSNVVQYALSQEASDVPGVMETEAYLSHPLVQEAKEQNK